MTDAPKLFGKPMVPYSDGQSTRFVAGANYDVTVIVSNFSPYDPFGWGSDIYLRGRFSGSASGHASAQSAASAAEEHLCRLSQAIERFKEAPRV